MSDTLELYVLLDENGNAVGHPYFGDNLRHALNIEPSTDPNYAPFTRITFEDSGVVLNLLQGGSNSYEKVNGVWQDVWTAVDLTGDDLTAQQADIANEITAFIQRRTAKLTSLMNVATSDASKQIYQNAINEVQAFTITDYNVPKIPWPTIPKLTPTT